jgi:S-adenosylmethionine-diacylgycerolhomoserine-N-methlytransferase
MSDAANLMDRMYRRQRHIYDASRKFYLLGRDRLIANLDPPLGGSVLEIGCGTGRNLVKLAQIYPTAHCFGLDVSTEMLDTACKSISRASLQSRIRLARADATSFDPVQLFSEAAFDRIMVSYALSMIPAWTDVLQHAVHLLAPGGSLHIVDFGDQKDMPKAFQFILNRWLALFDVTPRRALPMELANLAVPLGMGCRSQQSFRGYAIHAVVERPVIGSPA